MRRLDSLHHPQALEWKESEIEIFHLILRVRYVEHQVPGFVLGHSTLLVVVNLLAIR